MGSALANRTEELKATHLRQGDLRDQELEGELTSFDEFKRFSTRSERRDAEPEPLTSEADKLTGVFILINNQDTLGL